MFLPNLSTMGSMQHKVICKSIWIRSFPSFRLVAKQGPGISSFFLSDDDFLFLLSNILTCIFLIDKTSIMKCRIKENIVPTSVFT